LPDVIEGSDQFGEAVLAQRAQPIRNRDAIEVDGSAGFKGSLSADYRCPSRCFLF
jgi:hypothetical protein